MNRYIVLCIGLAVFNPASSQEILKVRTLAFMADLNSGDTTRIKSYFLPEAHIYHVDTDTMIDLTVSDFLYSAPNFSSGKFREEFYEIEVDNFENGFAYTNVRFRFFLDGEMAFTGLDHHCWTIRNGEYFIHSIHSSRTRPRPSITASPGSDDPTLQINNLMNKWHKDVATCHLEDYFSFMHESFYFLGTDPMERWSKQEFRKFCEPYFKKSDTWHFIPNWRNVYFSEDGNTAWFEESLDTWMEECRGSGVLMKAEGQWKIVHYNLSVVIENEKIKKFIKLREHK